MPGLLLHQFFNDNNHFVDNVPFMIYSNVVWLVSKNVNQGSISPIFFAKRKNAGARRLAKNSPFNFTNNQRKNCEAKFKA